MDHARRFLPAALLALTLAAPAAVLAHAPLESTQPEAGANLDEPPSEVVMTFGGELNPDGSEFVVTDASGTEVGAGEVDLDVADRNVMHGDVTIDEPGVYTVAWSSVAADGHPESGEFSFGYQVDPGEDGEAAGADDGGDAQGPPNSAVSVPAGHSPAVMLGAGLMGLALLAVMRAIGLELRRR